MIYLANPYSDPDPKVLQLRYQKVSEACAGLARKKLTVYSPIAHWHPIAMMYDLEKSYKFWKRMDQEMIRICNNFWVLTLDEWNESKGVIEETAYATSLNKEIKYISLEECIS